MKSLVRLAILVIVTTCFLPSHNALAVEDGTIVDRTSYRFPSYEQALQTTDVERYSDKSNYDYAVNDSRFEFEKLKYLSDGLKVVAYLYKPKQITGRVFPAIIYNRPSAIRGDIAPELLPLFHRLAIEGFVVLAPLLRQSDGGEGRDELGGADLNDLMNVVPLARSLACIDMNNLFMYGTSRGGMMTYQAVSRGFPIRAAAVIGALTDLQDVLDSHPKQYPLAMLSQLWPNYETRKSEIANARSAISWPEKLNVPLLIMHGGADSSVNTQQSLMLAQQLQKLGKVYELVIYAQDNHDLTKNQEDSNRHTISWFKRHMKTKVSDKL